MTLSDLERLAREATPGPWEWSDGFLWNGTTDKGVLAHGEVVEWPVSQESAAYIAAVSPERILALVAVARAAILTHTKFRDECDCELCRALAALEKL